MKVVLAQHCGHLRRNPDDLSDVNSSGELFRLSKLEQFGDEFKRAEMFKVFTSPCEYRGGSGSN